MSFPQDQWFLILSIVLDSFKNTSGHAPPQNYGIRGPGLRYHSLECMSSTYTYRYSPSSHFPHSFLLGAIKTSLLTRAGTPSSIWETLLGPMWEPVRVSYECTQDMTAAQGVNTSERTPVHSLPGAATFSATTRRE